MDDPDGDTVFNIIGDRLKVRDNVSDLNLIVKCNDAYLKINLSIIPLSDADDVINDKSDYPFILKSSSHANNCMQNLIDFCQDKLSDVSDFDQECLYGSSGTQSMPQLLVYNCSVCEDKFVDKDAYVLHMNSHESVFTCSVCGMCFRRSSALFQHISQTGHRRSEIGQISTDHKYGQCDVRTTEVQSTEFDSTIEEEHSGTIPEDSNITNDSSLVISDVSQLNSSSEIFTTVNEFHAHNLSDTVIKQNNEDVTNQLEENENIDIQENESSTEKELFENSVSDKVQKDRSHYTCPVENCTHSCINLDAYMSHANVCHPDCPAICPICNKTFHHRYSLKRHVLQHTNTKPYTCTICWKSFVQKCALVSHMLRHFSDVKLAMEAADEIIYGHQRSNDSGIVVNNSFSITDQGSTTIVCSDDINDMTTGSEMATDLSNMNVGETLTTQSIGTNSVLTKELNKLSSGANKTCDMECDIDNDGVNLIHNNSYIEPIHSTAITLSNMDHVQSNYKTSTYSEHKFTISTHTQHEETADSSFVISNDSVLDESHISAYHDLEEETEKLNQTLHIEIDSTSSNGKNIETEPTRNDKNTYRFVCNICKQPFKYKQGLQRHKVIHANAKAYPCTKCTKSFDTETELDTHITRHKSQRYKCDKCPKTFHILQSFKIHQITHLKTKIDVTAVKKQIKCQFTPCEREFECDRDLRAHVHADHPCSECDTRVKTRAAYMRHILQHNDERPYSCPYCTKRYKYQANFDEHIATHTGGKILPTCPVCARSFLRKSVLDKHVQKHYDESPELVCRDCNKTFPSKVHLSSHRLSHTKPHQCSGHCSKRFTTKQLLQVHILKYTGVKDFTCDKCNKKFTTKFDLKKHSVVHSSNFDQVCMHCGAQFARVSQLNRHLLIHKGVRNVKCDVCSKTFLTKAALTCHQKIHTDIRPFSCDKCTKTFKQKAHMLRHFDTHIREANRLSIANAEAVNDHATNLQTLLGMSSVTKDSQNDNTVNFANLRDSKSNTTPSFFPRKLTPNLQNLTRKSVRKNRASRLQTLLQAANIQTNNAEKRTQETYPNWFNDPPEILAKIPKNDTTLDNEDRVTAETGFELEQVQPLDMSTSDVPHGSDATTSLYVQIQAIPDLIPVPISETISQPTNDQISEAILESNSEPISEVGLFPSSPQRITLPPGTVLRRDDLTAVDSHVIYIDNLPVSSSNSNVFTINARGEIVPQIHGEIVPQIHGEIVPQIHGEIVPQIHGEIVPQIHGEIVPQIHGDVVSELIGDTNGEGRTDRELSVNAEICDINTNGGVDLIYSQLNLDNTIRLHNQSEVVDISNISQNVNFVGEFTDIAQNVGNTVFVNMKGELVNLIPNVYAAPNEQNAIEFDIIHPSVDFNPPDNNLFCTDTVLQNTQNTN